MADDKKGTRPVNQPNQEQINQDHNASIAKEIQDSIKRKGLNEEGNPVVRSC